jgi:hypothetical protein
MPRFARVSKTEPPRLERGLTGRTQRDSPIPGALVLRRQGRQQQPGPWGSFRERPAEYNAAICRNNPMKRPRLTWVV